MNPITLYHVHDPMCAWCYGFRQSLSVLLERLPKEVTVINLLGGLAPDSDEPMPTQMQEYIQSNWQRIEATIPGVTFNYEFWLKCSPRRSTYPACRAVIAARKQKPASEAKMIEAIQNAYYQQAKNPSDNDTLIALAVEMGLSEQQFADDLVSVETNDALEDEIRRSRSMNANSFPSLVIEKDGGFASMEIDYNHPQSMIDVITRIADS